MPSYLLRCSKTEPAVYVYWSDIVEAPVWIGDRDYAISMLSRNAQCQEPCCYAKQVTDRIVRADRTGSSALPGFYDWETEELIFEQAGVLPRECLEAFTRTLFEEGRDAALAYVQPFEDDVFA